MQNNSIKQKQFELVNENLVLKKEIELNKNLLRSFTKQMEEYSKDKLELIENSSTNLLKSPGSLNFNSKVSTERKSYKQITKDQDLNFMILKGQNNFNTKINCLCNNVLAFVNKIALLQECITKKLNNVKEMKMDFELTKKHLVAQAERYIQSNILTIYTIESLSICIKTEPSNIRITFRKKLVKYYL